MNHEPNLLKLIRTATFENQADAAKAIGTTRYYLSLLENGRLNPTKEVCQKLEKTFGLPTNVLLGPISVEKLMKVGA